MLGAQRGPPLHLQDGWLRVASSQERVDIEGQDPSGRAQQSQETADPQRRRTGQNQAKVCDAFWSTQQHHGSGSRLYLHHEQCLEGRHTTSVDDLKECL